MSIQVLPQGPSYGNSLYQGLMDTYQPMIQRELNQQQTAKAIQGIKNKSQGASPVDQLYNLIEASAISPEIGRSLGPLYEQLMRTEQTGKFFGGQGQGQGQGMSRGQGQGMSRGQPQQQGPAQNLQPQNTNQQTPINLQVSGGGIPATMQGQGDRVAGQPNPQPYTSSGVLPRIIPAEEVQLLAERAAQNQNDPSSLPGWLNYYNGLNDNARNARAEAENVALKMGIDQTEIPEFMKIGEQFSNETDVNNWAINTNEKYLEYKSNKEKLNNALIPGFFTGLTQGPKPRETAIKRLSGSVQDLIKSGHEPYVRAKLAEQDLSPTEIEEVIHPLTDNTFNSLEKLPKGFFPANKSLFNGKETEIVKGQPKAKEDTFVDYETALEKAPKEMKAIQNRLSNFFKNNVNDDTSLLVLRHKLWNDKDYDWRQIGPAIREAMSKGLKLNRAQLSELTELETQPPRQSISDVFADWGRWFDYFRGAK